MLGTFDEVIYVDWNSPNGRPLTDDITIDVNLERLKVITVTPERAKQLMGEEAYVTGQKCCEVLARNVGIRRATGDIIVSTNIDIIPPKREYLDDLLKKLKPRSMITAVRTDIDVGILEVIEQDALSTVIKPNFLNSKLFFQCKIALINL
jgi:hypothetical protein